MNRTELHLIRSLLLFLLNFIFKLRAFLFSVLYFVLLILMTVRVFFNSLLFIFPLLKGLSFNIDSLSVKYINRPKNSLTQEKSRKLGCRPRKKT